MSDPNVREIGRMDDYDGRRIVVGVDYDTVTLGEWRIDAEQLEDLTQLLARAAREVADREVDE